MILFNFLKLKMVWKIPGTDGGEHHKHSSPHLHLLPSRPPARQLWSPLPNADCHLSWQILGKEADARFAGHGFPFVEPLFPGQPGTRLKAQGTARANSGVLSANASAPAGEKKDKEKERETADAVTLLASPEESGRTAWKVPGLTEAVPPAQHRVERM